MKEFTEEEITQIKRDRADARSIAWDMLKYKLEKVRDGANVHTVNKAIFYIDYFLDHDEKRFAYGGKFDRLDELRYWTFLALKENDWRQLEEYMGGWF